MMRYLVFTFLFILYYSFTLQAQKCVEIESILVDACGTPEGTNEMVRFKIGPNNLNTSNLSFNWSANLWLGVCQNAKTARNVAALNRTILRCGLILEPVGGVLPAGKEVLFITSEDLDTLSHNFTNLTDTLYMVFQCGATTAGHFKNYQAGAGSRTTILKFTGAAGCSDTVTYIADNLTDINGLPAAADGASVNFTNAGVPSYFNNGCVPPLQLVNVNISTPDTFTCQGNSVLLNAIAQNYSSVKWKGGTGTFANSDSLNTVYTPAVNETYPIILKLWAYTQCVGDSVMDQITITKVNVNADAGSNTSICSGQNTTLTATGGGSYLWDANLALSCTSCAAPVATPTDTTTYYVTVTNNTCTARDSVTVYVGGAQVVDILISASQNNVCIGTTVDFTATVTNGGSAPIYKWQKNGITIGANDTTYSDNTLQNGDKITCIVVSNSTCASNATDTSNLITMLVTSIDTPVLNVTQISNVCQGDTLYFTASGINLGNNPSYQWQVNNVNVSGVGSAFNSNTLVNSDVVRCIISTLSACSTVVKDTSNILVVNYVTGTTPSISIVANRTSICISDSVIFSATTVNGGNTPTYNWIVNGVTTGVNSATYSAAFSVASIVYCQLTSSLTCVTSAQAISNTIAITINAAVTPTLFILVSDSAICVGQTVLFNAVTTNAGTAPIFNWMQNGMLVGTQSTYSPAQALTGDVFSCLLISNANCRLADSIMAMAPAILVFNLPIADAGEDTIVNRGETIVLQGSGGGIYNWSGSFITDGSTTATPSVAPLVLTTYTLTVTNVAGCSATDAVNVAVRVITIDEPTLGIPNAFSPNGDGSNDIFITFNYTDFNYLNTAIYNRWGEKVFESENPYVGWDGTYKGQAVPMGVYVYIIKAVSVNGNSRAYKGSLTLIK